MKLSESSKKTLLHKDIRPYLAITLGVTDQQVTKIIKTSSVRVTELEFLAEVEKRTGLTEKELFQNSPEPATV